MVAPLDIGLEQHDPSLDIGQDDIFDLSTTERAMLKRGAVELLDGNEDDSEVDEETSNDENELNMDGADLLDSEGEKEKKIEDLEGELEGMYDAYQDRLRQKDAKFKVRDLRQKNKEREEWHGIQEKGSDEDSDGADEGESEEGGWDAMEEAKTALYDDASDDSDELDDDRLEVPKGRKRGLPSDTSNVAKRPRLLTDLEEPRQKGTHATKLWFSRDVFAGEDDLEVESDEDEGSQESSQSRIDEQSDVRVTF